MRALLTGGAGFIGSHLAEALILQGHEVVVLDDLSTGRLENVAHLASSPGFRCVVGSRAYGLHGADSDVDRRGIYLPPADLHWSLYGVPETTAAPLAQGLADVEAALRVPPEG